MKQFSTFFFLSLIVGNTSFAGDGTNILDQCCGEETTERHRRHKIALKEDRGGTTILPNSTNEISEYSNAIEKMNWFRIDSEKIYKVDVEIPLRNCGDSPCKYSSVMVKDCAECDDILVCSPALKAGGIGGIQVKDNCSRSKYLLPQFKKKKVRRVVCPFQVSTNQYELVFSNYTEGNVYGPAVDVELIENGQTKKKIPFITPDIQLMDLDKDGKLDMMYSRRLKMFPAPSYRLYLSSSNHQCIKPSNIYYGQAYR